MAGSGFFLGGLAEGAETARKGALAERTQTENTGIAHRGLAIQEATEARAANQQMLDQGNKIFTDLMGHINETVKSAVSVGTPPEVLMPKIEPAVAQAERFGERIGRPPGLVRSQIQAMFSQPSTVQAAGVKGRGAAVEAVEEAIERKRALTPGAAPGPGAAPDASPGAGLVRSAPAPGDPTQSVRPAPGGAGVSARPPIPPPPTMPALTEADLVKYKNSAERVGIANTIRDDYFKQAKDFITIRDFKMRMDVTDKTGAGDIAIIFSYMKMLDPPSTVREGEQANARNAAGVPDAVVGMYNNLLKGGRLGPTGRKEILQQAEKIYQVSALQHDKLSTQFARKAKRNGLNVEDVVFDLYPAEIPAALKTDGGTSKPPPGFTVVP